MAQGKWPQVRDNLLMIQKWAREGLTEVQICKNLRIGKTTWEKYKKQYSELKAVLKKGKAPFIAEVENALAKRALGFEYEESKTYIKVEEGREVKYQEKTKKYYPPDVAACYILLKNKDRDENGKFKWCDNPAKLEIDRELAEIKKQVEEMKLF